MGSVDVVQLAAVLGDVFFQQIEHEFVVRIGTAEDRKQDHYRQGKQHDR